MLDYLIPSPVYSQLPENFSELGQTEDRPFDKAVLELNNVYKGYTTRCPIKSKLKFAWAARNPRKISMILEFHL